MSRRALPLDIRIIPLIVLALSVLIPPFEHRSGFMSNSNDSGLFIWIWCLLMTPYSGYTACFYSVPIATLLFLAGKSNEARIIAYISVALLGL